MDPFLIPIQIQLLNLVLYQVVPKYNHCLGDSPDVNVEATRIGIAEVSNVCQDAMLPLLGGIESGKKQILCISEDIKQIMHFT
jgi:hypothetical protein